VKKISVLAIFVPILASIIFLIGASAPLGNAPVAVAATVPSQAQEQPAVNTFSGKIMSQNGERFILRDDANEIWYHLDDQQEAGKFLGKTVLVTGVLDGRTATIRVRTIAEVSS